MSLAYDEVVGRTVETCERVPGFGDSVERALLVRAVTGRVRVVLALRGGADSSLLQRVQDSLAQTLESWFQGPVICPAVGPQGLRQLAEHLLADACQRSEASSWEACWPPGWPRQVSLPGEPQRSLEARWRALQIALGKEPWMGTAADPATPPWPMRRGAPRITAFYGFKGGVGRSTTVGILAYQLARQGRSVVCMDLDLEAPGLTRILRPDDLPVDRGWAIDELLSAAATGSGLDTLPLVRVDVHGTTFELVPAGVLGPTYVEKLARLDTLHRAPEKSPVHRALEGLLRRIRSRPEGPPDHILLDCRSGLHDLAGLALHDLAHVDVVVGRGDRQELDGLHVLLPALFRRRKEEDRRVLVLRTFMPLPIQESQLETYRSELYDLLEEHLYGDEPPSPGDRGIAHDPCPIGSQPEVANATWLGQVAQSTLEGERYAAVLRRLDALWHSDEA